MNEGIEVQVEDHAPLVFRLDEIINLIAEHRNEPQLGDPHTPQRVDRERFLLRICSRRLLAHVNHLNLPPQLVARRLGEETAERTGGVRVIRQARWGAALYPARDEDEHVMALIIYASNRDGQPAIESADLFRLHDPRITGRIFQYQAEDLVLHYDMLWMLKTEFNSFPQGCVVSSWVDSLQTGKDAGAIAGYAGNR